MAPPRGPTSPHMTVDPSTPSRRPSAGPSGSAPNTKRPEPLQSTTIPNGLLVDIGMLNVVVYEFQRQIAPMEPWATSVNETLADHAGHIDHGRTNLRVVRVFFWHGAGFDNQRQGRARAASSRVDPVV